MFFCIHCELKLIVLHFKWSHSNDSFICMQPLFAYSEAFEMKTFDISSFPPLLNCRLFFFLPSICTSVRAREKLYIPQWNARSNFLIISRAGCETASGPGLGSLAGVDCRVQWSVTGRDRGNSCVQVRGYDFILQLHLCVFHQERKECLACCPGFSFGCCRHVIKAFFTLLDCKHWKAFDTV